MEGGRGVGGFGIGGQAGEEGVDHGAALFAGRAGDEEGFGAGELCCVAVHGEGF